MPELPREELDKVFREGAGQYDFQFKPEAWDHMESLLDRERRRRILLWWWLGVAGLLVLIFGLGFYFFRAEAPAKDPILKHSTEEPVARMATPEIDNANNGLYTQQVPGKRQDGTAPAVAGQEEDTTSSAVQAQTNNPHAGNINANRAGASRSPDGKLSENMPRVTSAGREEKVEIVQQGAKTESVVSTESTSTVPEIFSLAGLPRSIYFPVLSRSLPDSLAFEPLYRQPMAEGAGKSKIIVGASLAGELVGVEMNDFSRLGIKAGITAEYLYFRRLGLGAGIHFLRKSYLAEKGEYHPPYGFWTRKIAPIYTDGSCNIVEIPVYLAYYTRGYDRPGLYGSFGASSYIMLREKYTYEYDVPDTDLIMDWSSNRRVEHWLSMLNFSIGYMGPLSKKLVYRLGLYGQSPLEGVGHGEVHLQSFGLQFTVSFQQLGKVPKQ